MQVYRVFILSILCIGDFHFANSQSEVKVWEEPLIIPTFVVKAPEKLPMFFSNQSYQGAKLCEWGPGPYGSMWDSEVLTDEDGPYAELMTGSK